MMVDDQVVLKGEALHHIRDVCRQHVGDQFEVLIGDGKARLVEIILESKNASIARVLETRIVPPLPEPHLVLALSIPRFPVFEAVLEKAVELGVAQIQPFFSDFSQIRGPSDVWQKKLNRFDRIINSATQQCGRGERMRLNEPLPLAEVFAQFNRTEGRAGLFAYEGAAALSAQAAVADIASRKPSQVWIFAGSEGGFSAAEVQEFAAQGLPAATLGSQVLRVETACVALVSVIKYGLDLMH